METDTKKNIGLRAVAVFVSISVMLSLVAAGFALIQRFQETNIRRDRQAAINITVCAAASADRKALRALVIQADKSLGTPKSAGYTYYKEHPDELAAAHAQNAYNLKKYLPRILCTDAGKAYKPGG